MTYSYIAYIDEAGDDGLSDVYREPGQQGGRSKWFIISALVMRYRYDLEAVSWKKDIVKDINYKSKNLHFCKLKHEQKVIVSEKISSFPVRGINIIDYKPMVPKEIYINKNKYYFYLSRYLIERISWLCRDMRRIVPEGDGRVKIIFSRRGGLQYSDFKSYMERLKDNIDNRIYWPVIDIDGINALDHSKLAGLQLVDALASGVASGLELNYYGTTEYRYAEILKRIIYNKNYNYLSYGMKFLKSIKELYPNLTESQKRMINLFK